MAQQKKEKVAVRHKLITPERLPLLFYNAVATNIVSQQFRELGIAIGYAKRWLQRLIRDQADDDGGEALRKILSRLKFNRDVARVYAQERRAAVDALATEQVEGETNAEAVERGVELTRCALRAQRACEILERMEASPPAAETSRQPGAPEVLHRRRPSFAKLGDVLNARR